MWLGVDNNNSGTPGSEGRGELLGEFVPWRENIDTCASQLTDSQTFRTGPHF